MSVTVTFTDQSKPGPSGPITAWHWDFGDGNTSTTESPSHAYAQGVDPTTFTVALTITGTSPDGTATVHKDITIGGTGGGGGGGSIFDQFITAANGEFLRPVFTPTRTVHFSNKAQLAAALADMHSGDLIQYLYDAGEGDLIFSNSAAAAYVLSGYEPAGDVVIDFGTARSVWEPSAVDAHYVRFTTSARQAEALVFKDCKNVHVLGGDYTSLHGSGDRMFGDLTDCSLIDGYIHNTGGSGIQVQPADSHTGEPRTQTGCKVRLEINRPCMDPSVDNHPDKGTGIHGALHHAGCGHLDGNQFIYYVHDALKPGEVSFGQTWWEGACGSICEMGTDSNGQPTSQGHNRYVLYGENLLMKCSVTPQNPGSVSGTRQTGGNGAQYWGSTPTVGDVIVFVGLVNCTGSPFHGTPEGWKAGKVTVEIGRTSNTLQEVNKAGHTAPNNVNYPVGFGNIYEDCT